MALVNQNPLPGKAGTTTILSGAAVYTPDGVYDPGTVVIADGRVSEVRRDAAVDPHDGTTFIDLAGKILAPGFIDLHIHGMMGLDVMQLDGDGFCRLAAEAVRRGITALAPTTVACPAADLEHAMANLHAARAQASPGARLLGLHLESNFINLSFKGAQPGSQTFSWLDPRAPAIRDLLERYAGEVSIVTMAPELPGGLELIHWLVAHGITVSLGHSGASYDEAQAGIDAGATHATHLFNAMPPLHHRNPGLVGAVLARKEVYAEVVGDGIHVHPAVIATALATKGRERFMAISDGLQVAGMTEGECFLGGQHISVQGPVAKLDNGTIAGSITTMDSIVRLLVNRVGCDLATALHVCSTAPADGIGRPDLGRIAPGAAADFVVLDRALDVQLTLVAGRTVYRR